MKTLSFVALLTYLFFSQGQINDFDTVSFQSIPTEDSSNEMQIEPQEIPFCTFTVFAGPNKGTYKVEFNDEGGFCYNDFENSQYVIEIHGSNYIDLMIILENLKIGRHDFSMEMQVAIDMSLNEGEDYFTFDNFYENREGFIEIEKIDNGYIYGRFEGLFGDGSVEEVYSMQMEGAFAVRIEEYED